MDVEVTRGTRWFVRAFLVVFLACGLLSIEAWPLTGFDMYARRRHATRTGWQVVALDSDGHEQPFAFQHLPVAYRKATKLFHRGPVDGRQHDACVALAGQLAARDREVVRVRVYLATYDVRTARRIDRQVHDACEPA